jgi:TPR repeat protein
MRNILSALVLGLSLLIASGGHSYAAASEKAWAAYNNGDFVTALREFSELAEQGDAKAQYNLGLMYAFGQGVIQDNVYAHMWWNIAALSGDSDAASYRDFLAKDMTSADISKAQGWSRECVKKKYKGC